VSVEAKWGHTLYNPEYLLEKNGGKAPLTYQSFIGLIGRIGDPPRPLPEPSVQLKTLPNIDYTEHRVPDLTELNIDMSQCGPCKFPGGETEALRRMGEKLRDAAWVCAFEKPLTSPNR
jgi:cryptochrome